MASPSWAAVSFTSDIEGKDDAPAGATFTLASVPGTTGDLIIAFFSWRANTGQTISGATYGGNAMTQICTSQAVGGGVLAGFYYTGASSTQNVVATFSAAPGNVQGSASVIAGADISGTPLGTASCGTDGGVSDTAYSQSVTIPANGMAIDGIMIRGGPTGIVADAGQTETAAQQTASSVYLRVSTEPASGDGTLGWSWTTNSTKAQIVVPINAAAGGGGGAQTFGFRLRVIQ